MAANIQQQHCLTMHRFSSRAFIFRPLPELTNGPIDEVSAAIGRNVAALIPNGACLQVCTASTAPGAACVSAPCCRLAWRGVGGLSEQIRCCSKLKQVLALHSLPLPRWASARFRTRCAPHWRSTKTWECTPVGAPERVG